MNGEPAIRLASFLVVLAAVAAWEAAAPRRKLTDRKSRRWAANLAIVAIDTMAVRLLVPLLPAGMALMAQELGWGILNRVDFPNWIEIALAVIALDFVIYLQHVLSHFLPVFWRLHRMHHTDLDIDVTTGNRFHPIEILVSTGIKLAAIALIGPSAAAVVAFEVILNATSQFNHGNIRMNTEVDRWLR
ncbi:MAG: sterol desaturase family protein, partial [Thermodesulfobacteriota bacterium]